MAGVPAMLLGINYAWLNSTVVINGIPLIGIKKIMISHKQEKENNYGYGTKPVGRSYGNDTYECSLDLYYDELVKFIAAAPNRDITKIPPFNFNMILAGGTSLPQNVSILFAEFTENTFDVSQNDKSVVVGVPLIIGDVRF